MGLGTLVLYGFGFTDIANPLERFWCPSFTASARIIMQALASSGVATIKSN
jgi:hypothetical protein